MEVGVLEESGSGSDGSDSSGYGGSGYGDDGYSGGLGGAGGGSNGGTGTGSTGSSGTSSSNTDPSLDFNDLITFPVIDDTSKIDKHLAQLNDITNDDTKLYKAKVNDLKQGLTNDFEIGFEFRTNDDGTPQPAIPGQSFPAGVKFPPAVINSLVRAHNHHNGLDPVFDQDDVKAIAQFFIDKNDLGATDDEDVTELMISRSGAFALKIGDANKVNAFLNDLKTRMNNKYEPILKEYKESYDLKVIKKSNSQCNGTCSDAEYNSLLEANLLIWLQYWDTGLFYYKGTLNPDGTYTWEKIN